MKFFIFISVVFIFSCAKPNYQNAQPIVPTEQGQDVDSCQMFLSVERICVDLVWGKSPSVTEFATFNLKFYIQENPNQLVDPSNNLNVVLWMPDMGHGSSPVTIEKISAGQYRISRASFFMAGEWEIRIQTKNGVNIVDQVTKNINL